MDHETPSSPVDDLVEIPLIGVKLPRPAIPWLAAALLAMLFLGWFFLSRLPADWFADEGYYSHGLLIPFMTLAVIYMRRDKIRAEPVGSSKLGLAVVVVGLLMLLGSKLIDNLSLAATGFILSLAGGIYYSFGARIGKHCLGPVLFLTFMMPVLGWAIDVWTNPLQLASTRVAEKLLNVAGHETAMALSQPTTIQLNNYTLNVGGPCSGFKLILSLTAFTCFFMMISGLGWKKNLFLLFISFPLALFINGLRIMLIGIVGEGEVSGGSMLKGFGNWLHNLGGGTKDAGAVFHDYSGYVTLIVCFIILHFIVKALEGRRPADAVPN